MSASRNRLSSLRDARELSRVDIASKLRVSERTVYRWESGEVTIPDRHKLSLAELFGVSVVWLMGWDSAGNGNGGDAHEATA